MSLSTIDHDWAGMPFVDIAPLVASDIEKAMPPYSAQGMKIHVNLTDEAIRAARPGQREAWVHDEVNRQLAVRIRPSGGKSFYFVRSERDEFPSRRKFLGDTATYSVAQARKKAEWTANPNYSQFIEPPPKLRRDIPIETAVTEYFKDNRTITSGWRGTVENLFERQLVPRFAGRTLSSIHKDEWLLLIELVALERKSRGVNLHKASRAFLYWAARCGLIEANPLARTRLDLIPHRAPHYLGINDLVAIHDAAQSLGHPWGAMIGLAILTGEPIEDVRRIRADQIDWKRAMWRVNGGFSFYLAAPPRDVDLPPQAMDLLAPYRQARGLLFPSPRSRLSQNPINLHAGVIKQLRTRSGVKGDWDMRDVRREVAREMKHLGKRPTAWAEQLDKARAEAKRAPNEMADIVL